MSEKVIYGQAWIFEDKLVQDITRFSEDGTCTTGLETIIDNIWDDLLSDGGQWKSNGKGYFYWEVDQTSMENDDVTVKVMIPCPQPKFGLFEEPLDPEEGSEYAQMWKKRIQTRRENAEKETTIQRKEIYLQGFSFIDENGNTVTYPEMTVNNTPDGDIASLLNILF